MKPEEKSPQQKNQKTQSALQRILGQLKGDYRTVETIEADEDELAALRPPEATFDPLSKVKRKKGEYDAFEL